MFNSNDCRCYEDKIENLGVGISKKLAKEIVGTGDRELYKSLLRRLMLEDKLVAYYKFFIEENCGVLAVMCVQAIRVSWDNVQKRKQKQQFKKLVEIASLYNDIESLQILFHCGIDWKPTEVNLTITSIGVVNVLLNYLGDNTTLLGIENLLGVLKKCINKGKLDMFARLFEQNKDRISRQMLKALLREWKVFGNYTKEFKLIITHPCFNVLDIEFRYFFDILDNVEDIEETVLKELLNIVASTDESMQRLYHVYMFSRYASIEVYEKLTELDKRYVLKKPFMVRNKGAFKNECLYFSLIGDEKFSSLSRLVRFVKDNPAGTNLCELDKLSKKCVGFDKDFFCKFWNDEWVLNFEPESLTNICKVFLKNKLPILSINDLYISSMCGKCEDGHRELIGLIVSLNKHTYKSIHCMRRIRSLFRDEEAAKSFLVGLYKKVYGDLILEELIKEII